MAVFHDSPHFVQDVDGLACSECGHSPAARIFWPNEEYYLCKEHLFDQVSSGYEIATFTLECSSCSDQIGVGYDRAYCGECSKTEDASPDCPNCGEFLVCSECNECNECSNQQSKYCDECAQSQKRNACDSCGDDYTDVFCRDCYADSGEDSYCSNCGAGGVELYCEGCSEAEAKCPRCGNVLLEHPLCSNCLTETKAADSVVGFVGTNEYIVRYDS